MCNSGEKEGICRKTGAGYRIICNVCGEEVLSKYEGETGRNLYTRGDEHAQCTMHNGVMERPIFQLKMDATQFLKSSHRRKANEEVRIANIDPTIRMNSCYEFRQ